jgi:AbrB family looped-hinge helix DNA binding protein
VHHHVSYYPEVIQIMCRRCHYKVHSKSWNGKRPFRIRPTEYRSSLYDDSKVVYYLRWLRKDRPEKKNDYPSVSIGTVHGKGKVQIPKGMRVALDIKDGDYIIIYKENEKIYLEKRGK